MITFVLPEGALERVAVAYSPLVEAFFSLDVLTEPKHHPLHHAWVRRARKLAPALRREIAFFSYYYDPYIPSPIATYPTGDYPSFDAELERRRPQPGGDNSWRSMKLDVVALGP